MSFFDFLYQDVAIDLGTVNTLIYLKGKGIVLNEPSIIAFNTETKQIIGIGHSAAKMYEKTHPEIKVIKPLAEGVIADYEAAESMIREFIKKVEQKYCLGIRKMVIGVPSGITPVERRAIEDTATQTGANEVYLVSEPMAAAIGMDLDVESPFGNMVVDIGGGTTDVAVISLSGIAAGESIRVAGNEITESIIRYFRKNHSFAIGEKTAEVIKQKCGSAIDFEEELEITVKGTYLINGLPGIVKIDSSEIREAIEEPISKIILSIKKCLEKTPPELSIDILDRGIMLTGGGSLVKGLDQKISKETNLPVYISENPLTAVVLGVGKIMEDTQRYNSVTFNMKRR